MHNIQRAKDIAENSVMNVILDACRANPNRDPRDVAGFNTKCLLLLQYCSAAKGVAAMQWNGMVKNM